MTGPLIAGRDKKANDLLTPAEYRKLAWRLRELNAQPADLLAPAADRQLGNCANAIERARLERLLARGFLLSQAVERWHARAIWVVSRADATYPQRLKSRQREDAPAVLYGCGDVKILDSGGLAVVGSRNVDEALIEYVQEVGRLAATSGRTAVSGGARGIDQAAMRGALAGGWRAGRRPRTGGHAARTPGHTALMDGTQARTHLALRPECGVQRRPRDSAQQGDLRPGRCRAGRERVRW